MAFVRGIDVGGKSLPMKELVSIVEDIGARDVKTCIQSGDTVFLSKSDDAPRLASRTGSGIKERRGFEPRVLVLRLEDIEEAIAGNPFPEAESDPTTLHLGFLASVPDDPDVMGLESLKKASERFRLIDRVFYLHAPEGVGRSKLAANAERLLGVVMTDRNWRTVLKIEEMARASRRSSKRPGSSSGTAISSSTRTTR